MARKRGLDSEAAQKEGAGGKEGYGAAFIILLPVYVRFSSKSESAFSASYRVGGRGCNIDRPIKKKPQGKRNLPADEVVSKWLIIETLERATPEEIVQLAFVW